MEPFRKTYKGSGAFDSALAFVRQQDLLEMRKAGSIAAAEEAVANARKQVHYGEVELLVTVTLNQGDFQALLVRHIDGTVLFEHER
jgi:hypothetical protein